MFLICYYIISTEIEHSSVQARLSWLATAFGTTDIYVLCIAINHSRSISIILLKRKQVHTGPYYSLLF